jgi:hypothetical protein
MSEAMAPPAEPSGREASPSSATEVLAWAEILPRGSEVPCDCARTVDRRPDAGRGEITVWHKPGCQGFGQPASETWTAELVVGDEADPIVVWACAHQHAEAREAWRCAVAEVNRRSRWRGRPSRKVGGAYGGPGREVHGSSPRVGGVRVERVRDADTCAWQLQHLDGRSLGVGLFQSQERALAYARGHGWPIVCRHEAATGDGGTPVDRSPEQAGAHAGGRLV